MSSSLSVPGYEILDELAQMGNSEIHRALKLDENRLVALKISRSPLDPELLKRFSLESRSLSTFQHPGIVNIYDVGEVEGRPYLALELVEGDRLSERLRQKALSIEDAAQIIEHLSLSMNAAHHAGVRHLNLNPCNVLFTSEGEPKLHNFALLHRQSSIPYLSPEQANEVSSSETAIDIHALGALLYHCLTGSPPFRGATPADTRLQIQHHPPLPPRQLRHATPEDLELICLKCLEKNPEERYASAVELADDLGRWRRGEPIRARSDEILSRLKQWTWRHRIAILLIVGLMLASLTILMRSNRRVSEEKAQAQKARESQLRAETEQRHLAQVARVARLGTYALQIDLARREWEQGNLGSASRYLERTSERFRGWEHRWLRSRIPMRTLRPERAITVQMIFSHDGKYLVTHAKERSGSRVEIWDRKSQKLLRSRPLSGNLPELQSLALDRNNELAVPLFVIDPKKKVTYDVVKLLEIPSMKLLKTFVGVKARIQCLALSPDGQRIAASYRDGSLVVWSRTGQKQFQSQSSPPILSMCFSPTDRSLVVSRGSVVQVLSEAGKQLQSIDIKRGPARCLSISSDGKTLLIGASDAHVWNLTAQTKTGVIPVSEKVSALTFTKDQNHLRIATVTGSVHEHRLADSKGFSTFRSACQMPRCVSFDPDGDEMACAASRLEGEGRSYAYPIYIHRATTGEEFTQVRAPSKVTRLALSIDGSQVAIANKDRVQIWDAGFRTRQSQFTTKGEVKDLLFIRKNLYILSTHKKQSAIQRWNGNLKLICSRGGAYRALAISDDERDVVCIGAREVLIGSLQNDSVRTIPTSGQSVAFVRNRIQTLTLQSVTKQRLIRSVLRSYEVGNGKELESIRLSNEAQGISRAAFHPRESRLVLASENGARVIETVSGRAVLTLTARKARIADVSWSGDGNILAVAYEDGVIRLWITPSSPIRSGP